MASRPTFGRVSRAARPWTRDRWIFKCVDIKLSGRKNSGQMTVWTNKLWTNKLWTLVIQPRFGGKRGLFRYTTSSLFYGLLLLAICHWQACAASTTPDPSDDSLRSAALYNNIALINTLLAQGYNVNATGG